MNSIHKQWIFIILSVTALSANGQSNTISGKIYNNQNKSLESAIATLVNQSDSLIAGFAITDSKGRFFIDNLEYGLYKLQITFLGFIDKEIFINFQTNDTLFLETITLLENNFTLEEILITAKHPPVRVKNDTIEYTAGAFKVSSHANVGKLLKKLPGLIITKDGTILSKGKTISNILVNGKEFFGNDPGLIAKILPADIVDKIQVFDTKSKAEEFTGISDGNESRTLNISLKKKESNAPFGSSSLGIGSKERWKGRFNINLLGTKSQFSAIGSANNINEQDFSHNTPNDQLGGFGRGLSSSNLSSNNNEGFADIYSFGLNYNNKLNKKTNLSSNYLYFYSGITSNKTSNSQNSINEGTYTINEKSLSQRTVSRHKLNIYIDSRFDSSQLLSINSVLSLNKTESNRLLNRASIGLTENIDSESFTSNIFNMEQFTFSIRSNYSKRFRKNNRILNIRSSLSSVAIGNQSLLNSLNSFHKYQYQEFINQRQVESNENFNYTFGISYIEPLGKNQYLDFTFSRQNYDSDFKKNFFDRILNPIKYEELNEVLSNAYNRSFLYNRLSASYRLNRTKYKLLIGIQHQFSNLIGLSKNIETQIRKKYVNLLPRIDLKIDFNRSTRANINYSTSIQEPNLKQLQPITTNTVPLYLYVGNPKLDVAFSHRLRFNLNKFNSATNTFIITGANLTYTKNRITNNQTIDANFVQRVTPINVKNDYRYQTYASFNAPLKFLGMKYGINQDMNISNSILYLNGQEDNVIRSNHGVTLTFENKKKEKIDWLIGGRIGYNKAAYKKNENLNQDYFDQNYYIDISSDFAKGWYFETSFDYKIYSAESFGERTTLPIWRASVSKNFLKNEKGQLTLSAVDLLNQNLGINRSNNLNYILEERVVSLGRYFMVTMGYKFSGFGAKDGHAIKVKTNRRR